MNFIKQTKKEFNKMMQTCSVDADDIWAFIETKIKEAVKKYDKTAFGWAVWTRQIEQRKKLLAEFGIEEGKDV